MSVVDWFVSSHCQHCVSGFQWKSDLKNLIQLSSMLETSEVS